MNSTSISDNGQYPTLVNEAVINENIFNTFKRHPWYTPILEHVNYDDGIKYLDIIRKEYDFLLKNIDKYKTNDNIGSPVKYDFGLGEMSATTLRYIKVLGDLTKQFNDLNGLDVVEIGCGYGGQCKIILDTFDVKSYTIIDLPIVLELIKKYLTRLNINMDKIIFKDITTLNDDEKYDLFISNYAYTECSDDIRDIYFKKVISKSNMGYLTANFLSPDVLEQEIMSRVKNSFKIKEEPHTGDGNVIIIWK